MVLLIKTKISVLVCTFASALSKKFKKLRAKFVAVFFIVITALMTTLASTNLALAKTIKLGMSAPFSGPTKALGINLRLGAEQFFKQYNQTPAGKKNPIKLISYDDGYEPSRTIANTRRLIKEDNVFALFGYVGTPTTQAILPMIEKYKMLFFAPYTGAEFLHNPINPHVFNIRTSYFNEAELQLEYFSKHYDLKNIALFIQADAFGIAASEGYVKALTKRSLSNITQVRYKRNSQDIAQAVKKIAAIKPDIVLCVGTYQPISKLINTLRSNSLTMPITMVSFAGAEALHESLTDFEEVYISTVVNDPFTSSLPIVKEYRHAMEGLPLSHESLEGYINAKVFTQILNKSSIPVTPESFTKAAESTRTNIANQVFEYTKENHSGNLPAILNKVGKNGVIELPNIELPNSNRVSKKTVNNPP